MVNIKIIGLQLSKKKIKPPQRQQSVKQYKNSLCA